MKRKNPENPKPSRERKPKSLRVGDKKNYEKNYYTTNNIEHGILYKSTVAYQFE